MTTCAECRYHHDRGCYIAPVSVFRLATAPACAQIATIAAQDAPGAPERARGDGDGPETLSVAEARWREEATRVLQDWQHLEHLVPESFIDGRLGHKWPDVVADYIRHLQANPKENDQ